jgi:hypothetical protein
VTLPNRSVAVMVTFWSTPTASASPVTASRLVEAGVTVTTGWDENSRFEPPAAARVVNVYGAATLAAVAPA